MSPMRHGGLFVLWNFFSLSLFFSSGENGGGGVGG